MSSCVSRINAIESALIAGTLSSVESDGGLTYFSSRADIQQFLNLTEAACPKPCNFAQSMAPMWNTMSSGVNSGNYSLLCDGEKPTVAPTLAPTDSPTDSPTVGPTDSPTVGPTGAPSDSPTGAPSDAPSWSPTTSPTAYPTPTELNSNYTREVQVKTKQTSEKSSKAAEKHTKMATQLRADERRLKAQMRESQLVAMSQVDTAEKLYTAKFAKAAQMRAMCSSDDSFVAKHANTIQAYIKSVPLPAYAQKASIMKKQIITNVLQSLEVLSRVQRATDLHGEYMLSHEAHALMTFAENIKKQTPALKQIDALRGGSGDD